ncbi:ketoacyl-ACP synthase III [Streptomyces sp. TRM66268-LWL]|uniref:Ketoacyl-ACP synthase III n=1 Tax=Streptomyces polyasparticus TaxID=2767826 RepID=A0ABR7S638_9ACTN|nr:ketoacyl-ACP synthase III [Streptomyces polyasparticus]MBC9710961.1 ketoacyl-ACP synthase III [Streptomyces polyasparticus]
MSVGIRSIGVCVPEKEVTNAQLVERYDTTDAWMRERLGIHSRRIAGPGEFTSDLALGALEDACKRAAVDPASIDLLICCTSTPDHMIPAVAALILRKAQIHGVPGFDVNAGGCAGGLYGLDVGLKYVQSGQYERVAVVVADTVAQLNTPDDRTQAAIFGDGAACYLLERCSDSPGIGRILLGTDPERYYTAFVERCDSDGQLNRFSGSNVTRMDAKGVKSFALDVVPGFVDEVTASAGVGLDDVRLIITHQANPTLVRELVGRLGQPADKAVIVADKYGNTSGSSVVIALAEAERTGRLHPGDRVLLLGFGAGMSYGGTVVHWCGSENFPQREW